MYVCVAREFDGYKFLNNSQDAHEKQKNITEKFVFRLGKRKADHKKLIHFVCCDFIIHESLYAAHLSLSQPSISWEMKIIKLLFPLICMQNDFFNISKIFVFKPRVEFVDKQEFCVNKLCSMSESLGELKNGLFIV